MHGRGSFLFLFLVVFLVLVGLSASAVLKVYDLFSRGYSEGFMIGREVGLKEAELNFSEEAMENFTRVLQEVYFNLTGRYWYEKGRAEGYVSALRELEGTSLFYSPIVVSRLSQRPVVDGSRVTLNFDPRFGSHLGVVRVLGTSRSMSPSIEPGYTLVVQYEPRDLKVGDIVGFPASLCQGSEGSYTYWIHRIVKFQKRDGKTYVVTKGDGNRFEDRCNLTRSDVSYRVVAIIPSSLD